MTESDRVFVATIAQIVPVLLLALVVEARFFKFTHADALPSVKQARTDLRKSMTAFEYGGWRTLVAIRRWGLGLSLSLTLVGILALVEVAALWLLAEDVAPTEQTAHGLVVAVGIGCVAAGVLPVYHQLVQRNVQLSNLEIEVQAAVDARIREQEAARAMAELASRKRRGWRRLFPR